MIAVGVRFIAAFRGRSLLGRFGFVADGVADCVVEGVFVTGFDFWASVSVTLMLCFSDCAEEGAISYCPVIRGGRVLLISGDTPAIDVSGMFVLRGGGGVGSRVRGW